MSEMAKYDACLTIAEILLCVAGLLLDAKSICLGRFRLMLELELMWRRRKFAVRSKEFSRISPNPDTT